MPCFGLKDHISFSHNNPPFIPNFPKVVIFIGVVQMTLDPTILKIPLVHILPFSIMADRQPLLVVTVNMIGSVGCWLRMRPAITSRKKINKTGGQQNQPTGYQQSPTYF
jgi:hypothetical protein